MVGETRGVSKENQVNTSKIQKKDPVKSSVAGEEDMKNREEVQE